MKLALLIVLATVSFAQTKKSAMRLSALPQVEKANAARLQAMTTGQAAQPSISLKTLKEVEKATDARLQASGQDPWGVLGDTRGAYLPGYGAIFTFEMALANLTPISPFHMTVTPEEKKSGHDRKKKNLVTLKTAMRETAMNAANALAAMPGDEQITVEAYLFYFSWEDKAGLPERLIVSANRQKIADAVARHASAIEMASLFEERSE